MPVLYQKIIKREDLKANPKVLYLFGDNDARSGFGGQAKEMRGEPNAVGIRTKKRPSRDDSAYYNDNQLERNCAKIDEDFDKVIRFIRSGGTIVVPLDGLGTGLSDMKTRCPKTFGYLQRKLDSLELV